jgi:hypothetical protein
MQRLVKCCLRAAFFSAELELPAKGMQAPRAPCGYGALVWRFTARRYSATAGDALRPRSHLVLVAFAILLVGWGGDRSVEQLERGLELRDKRRRAGESHDVILGAAEV